MLRRRYSVFPVCLFAVFTSVEASRSYPCSILLILSIAQIVTHNTVRLRCISLLCSALLTLYHQIADPLSALIDTLVSRPPRATLTTSLTRTPQPPLLVSRFIMNLRQLGDANAEDPSSDPARFSKFSAPNFHISGDLIGNIGEPLDHSAVGVDDDDDGGAAIDFGVADGSVGSEEQITPSSEAPFEAKIGDIEEVSWVPCSVTVWSLIALRFRCHER